MNNQKTNIVLIGCGAMALETASYIDDISYNLGSVNDDITVSGIFLQIFTDRVILKILLDTK